jgi:hypothetical protein
MADEGSSERATLTRPGNYGGTLKVWPKGKSGNPSGLSRERRELYRAIEEREIPKVLDMLDALYQRGIAGSDSAARMWLDHVRGPVKPRDDDAIESAVEQKVMEMIAEARARKAAESGGSEPR